MKKILDGIRYDTDAAELLAVASRGEFEDLDHFVCALYRSKRAGRYFLHGQGGPMSRFGQAAGNNKFVGSRDLIPLTKEEALQWAEQYLTVEEIERAFPGEIEDA